MISRPIAGTRRRGRTDEDDRRLAGELRENPKEVAEHVMLVDLARNDVGRVARFGTMHVDELLTLERYSHVMHLTSQVSGDLVDGRGPIDVLRATLPAGTVSGAPKVRAMEIIDDLEPVKRGPYAGVVGYVDFSGNLDTAIAIRTMFVGPHGASLQAGAGIVADSDPRRRGPRVPQQGGGVAGCGAGGAADDAQAGRGRNAGVTEPFWCTTTRDAVRVTGKDAVSYLQSQLSQELGPLPVGASAWSLLLQPNGRVDALLRVRRTGDEELVVDADRGWGEAVLARLQRFRIRVAAELQPAELAVIAVRGDGLAMPPGAEPAWWGPEHGFDLLDVEAGPPVGVAAGDEAALEAARVVAGWPAMGREITEQTIPAELGPLLDAGRQLHQGLLSRPGAGGAHELPGGVGTAGGPPAGGGGRDPVGRRRRDLRRA